MKHEKLAIDVIAQLKAEKRKAEAALTVSLILNVLLIVLLILK